MLILLSRQTFPFSLEIRFVLDADQTCFPSCWLGYLIDSGFQAFNLCPMKGIVVNVVLFSFFAEVTHRINRMGM